MLHQALDALPRTRLGGTTPLERLDRLSAENTGATLWAKRDAGEDRSHPIWMRYVREGVLYEGSEHFGSWCPEPDLARLRAQERPSLPVAAATGLAVVLGGLTLGWLALRGVFRGRETRG